ncbi:dirigent protein 17-like [Mangifera indica]|uniref:dirigent protein 17-like n=1 Tax=Mangifera indica TaxID=29780 RepID=UPI001CF98902|nr:dirigent protein 17-like [Mangifera indica]XP_044474372.1 dirigent protein 17-like [Mangifera indica]XP_044474373.1 dirigent protein 17-like [Mangifera indica]
MENRCKEIGSEVSMTEVFELPGEAAVVINGVPAISSSSEKVYVLPDMVNDAKSPGDAGFGDWLEGREVQKLFGEQYYTGTVIQFDKKSGWYRVVYEDGDSEDLDWPELEEVLLPLDISVPLKTLAMKIIKKNQKPINISQSSLAPSLKQKTRKMGSKGKNVDAQEAPVINITIS